MIKNYLLKHLIHSSLSASEILVLIFIYSRLGESDYIDTKFIELAEQIPYLSRASVYNAIHSLDEKGYIRVERYNRETKKCDKRIYRTDTREDKGGKLQLIYKIFERIVKIKEVCSSSATLRALLHYLLRILSAKNKGVSIIKVAKSLSEKLLVSKRTAFRVIKLLHNKRLIGVKKNKKGRHQTEYIIWIPKKYKEPIIRDDKKLNDRSLHYRYLVDHILRTSKKDAEEKDRNDTAFLFTQHRAEFEEMGMNPEKMISIKIYNCLKEGYLNPSKIHKEILDELDNPGEYTVSTT